VHFRCRRLLAILPVMLGQSLILTPQRVSKFHDLPARTLLADGRATALIDRHLHTANPVRVLQLVVWPVSQFLYVGIHPRSSHLPNPPHRLLSSPLRRHAFPLLAGIRHRQSSPPMFRIDMLQKAGGKQAELPMNYLHVGRS
jgi:hypothetical protein